MLGEGMFFVLLNLNTMTRVIAATQARGHEPKSYKMLVVTAGPFEHLLCKFVKDVINH